MSKFNIHAAWIVPFEERELSDNRYGGCKPHPRSACCHLEATRLGRYLNRAALKLRRPLGVRDGTGNRLIVFVGATSSCSCPIASMGGPNIRPPAWERLWPSTRFFRSLLCCSS